MYFQDKPTSLHAVTTNKDQCEVLWIVLYKISAVATFEGLCSQSKPLWIGGCTSTEKEYKVLYLGMVNDEGVRICN